jgi:5-methylcytosine-specific restriction endonuclease McrA
LHIPEPEGLIGGAAATAAVLSFLSRWLRGLAPVRKDPKRLFTATERMRCFQRAGNRCEHKALLLPRCSRAPEAGDHVYPHSRGGATVMSNCQALCRAHNSRKSGRVPSALYLARLERRRRSYFPPGEPVKVVWRFRPGARRPGID